ncbi:MAG: TonB-dependent receptor [Pseudomonadales bacterium]
MTNQKPTGIRGGCFLAWALAWVLVMTALPPRAFAEEGIVEEIVVTGSRIKRINAEDANPLVVITTDDIRDVGYNSFQEVLASLTQNSGGSLDQQQVFGFTPAASAVDLRGVGIGRTLTLIDGKRTPKYPIPAGGTDNFSDTANIPLAAIERVEVLTTGASAIYGSDAMGGVVNIITREFYNGANLDVRYADTAHGGLETAAFNLMVGTGDDDRSVLFLAEYEIQDALRARQRNNFDDLGSDLAYGGLGSYSAYGNSLVELTPPDYDAQIVTPLQEPECGDRGLQTWNDGLHTYCGFDRSTRRDLFPERDRASFMAKFDYAFSDALELYGRLDYTWSNTYITIEPMFTDDYTFYVDMDENGNPDPGFVTGEVGPTGSTARFPKAAAFGGDFAGATPETIAYYARRMIEFGDRRQDADVNNAAALLGVRGEVGRWSWDADWSYMRTRYEDKLIGYASADSYFAYLTSPPSGRSAFDLMTPEEVAAVRYTPFNDAESTINQFSVTVTNPGLFELPAGAVGFAAGAEHAKEWFHNTSDPESIRGAILSTGGSSGKGSRDYSAVYGEMLIPVIDSIEVQAALRYDDYSDFGDNWAPLIGVQFRPTGSVLLRANWAKTFRAPDLQRVYGDPTLAFEQVTDPYACEYQGGSIGPDSPFAACRGETFVDVSIGPNPDLDAEQGENYGVGGVFQRGGFDASIDWWHVEVEDIVNDLSAQTIVNNYETYAALIEARDPVTQEVVAVNATARNLTFQETEGVDFSLGYRLPWDDWGQFELRWRATYMIRWEEQFDVTSAVVDVLHDDRVPEWRWNLTTNWIRGRWGATLFVSYIDSMNALFNELYDQTDDVKLGIDAWTTANVSAYWTNDALRVQAGVNNVTDEGPNPDETDAWPFYPQEYHNAIGRQYYLRVSYDFGR